MKYRYDTTGFVFYEESIRRAVQLMILDFFDFHAYNYGEDSITPQYAAVMNKFLLCSTAAFTANTGSDILCLGTVYNAQIPFGNLQKSERTLSQLLDQPLHIA